MSKYGNRKTIYNGCKYDSAAEAKQAFELDVMRGAGLIEHWERQVRVPLRVSDQLICNLVLDFRIDTKIGSYFLEVKGMETPVYKLKLKLFKAIFPKADLRVVKV